MNMLFTTLSGSDGELIHVPPNTFLQKPIKRRPAASVGASKNQEVVEISPKNAHSPELLAESTTALEYSESFRPTP